MENIENVIKLYGSFCSNITLALAFNDESALKGARESLKGLYQLMSEEKIKDEFPKVYERIQNYRKSWDLRTITPDGITNKDIGRKL